MKMNVPPGFKTRLTSCKNCCLFSTSPSVPKATTESVVPAPCGFIMNIIAWCVWAWNQNELKDLQTMRPSSLSLHLERQVGGRLLFGNHRHRCRDSRLLQQPLCAGQKGVGHILSHIVACGRAPLNNLTMNAMHACVDGFADYGDLLRVLWIVKQLA